MSWWDADDDEDDVLDESDVRVRPNRRGSRPRTKQRPEHAGHARHLVFVDDLDALVAQLAERGLTPAERETYANGVRKVGRSRTAAVLPSTSTASMPNAGRSWVGRACAITSQAARTWRTPRALPSRPGSNCSARAVS